MSTAERSAFADADPLQALRAATQPLHRHLDASLPLGRDGAGMADYLHHLQVLQGWLTALEPMLRLTGWGAGYLRTVASELSAAQPAPGAGSYPPASQDAHAFGWGVAYVVEGSQLGGQVLVRRLRQAGVDHPLAYLQGRGEGTGAHWRAFLVALRAALVQPGAICAACDGACWAFDDLLARFVQRGLLA